MAPQPQIDILRRIIYVLVSPFECHAKNLNFLATCCRIRTELRKTTCPHAVHAGACARTNHHGIPPSVPRTERRKRQTSMTKAVTSPTPRLTTNQSLNNNNYTNDVRYLAVFLHLFIFPFFNPAAACVACL